MRTPPAPSLIHATRRSALPLAYFLTLSAFAAEPTAPVAPVAPVASVRFNEQIRPILAEYCLHCHGPDSGSREADLRLDVEAAAKAARPGQTVAIVPGNPEASGLYQRVTAADPDLRMPPPATGKTLSERDQDLLRQWIKEGAGYAGHWSLAPIRRPDLPQASTPAPPASPIDQIVTRALAERGLALSPPASKTQLLRRATLDLTGLPPTWAETQAFLADTSPDAFARVVDRLLEAPGYGERWGRHWLDIARYADTHGGAAIGFTKFPFSYTYRDYVIDAFQRDVPYDQFLREQLAADQLNLPENDPRLAGLGFLTVGMQFRSVHDLIDDQIDVTTRGLMGLTVTCARCHDHKYDPISLVDYYSLYATFASSQPPPILPVIGTPPDSPASREYQANLARLQTEYDDMARDQAEVMRHRLRMQVGLYLREIAKGTPEQDVSAAFLSYRTDDLRPTVLNRWRDYLQKLPETDPVFGPWLRLSRLQAADFSAEAATVLQTLVAENGDPSKFPPAHSLAADAPKWNPRVLAELTAKKPASLLDVADAYGSLFATVQREWLGGLLASAEEAVPGGTVIPDEDGRHGNLNGMIHRQLRRHLYEPGTPIAMPDELAVKMLNRTVIDTLNGKRGAIQNLHHAGGSPPRAMTLSEDSSAREFFTFRRGNPVDRGEPVTARFLSALGGSGTENFTPGRRRLELAEAIVDPANPLTRRVVVNWLWQNHFGQGLVRTPDDFGSRGQPPALPALLDYLAERLLDHGWSLKQLHREVMLSAVYQQGAIEDARAREADPDNELFWRMPRRRLEFEAMRDAMLAVSGELKSDRGGRPFDLHAEPAVPRRSVYGFINRDIVSTFASTFDSANPNSCTAKRPETVVPQQTLFALNSEFIQARAEAMARLPEIASAPDPAERVRRLYQRVFCRLPDAEETRLALAFLTPTSAGDPAALTAQLAHVLLASNEFVFVD